MKYYFTTEGEKGFRGRRKTNLPITLTQDLNNIYNALPALWDHNYYCRLCLNNNEDLEVLRILAKDRREWRRLVDRIFGRRRSETLG